MEKLNKKILLKREIQTGSTTNNGIVDSIVFKSKTSKSLMPNETGGFFDVIFNIQFTLYEDIKNMGLYTETDTIPKEK